MGLDSEPVQEQNSFPPILLLKGKMRERDPIAFYGFRKVFQKKYPCPMAAK
jgi:hypothetical protein